MKKKNIVVICLALCAGLFVLLGFLLFGKGSEEVLSLNQEHNDEEIIIQREEYTTDPGIEISTLPAVEDSSSSKAAIVTPDIKEEEDAASDNNYKTEPETIIKEEKKAQGIEYISYSVSQDEADRVLGELSDADLSSLCGRILRSSQVYAVDGTYIYSCDFPKVPENMHLGLKVEVFKDNGEGDNTLFRYTNDAAWLSGADYDKSERAIMIPLCNVEGCKLVIEIRALYTEGSNEWQLIDIIWSPDGPAEILSMEG